MRRLAVVLVAALVAGGCGSGDEEAGPSSTSSTSSTAPSSTTASTSSTTAAATTAARPPTSGTTRATPAPTAAPAPATCPAIPARNAPRADRPRYTLRIDVKPAENVVDGETAVRFTPDLPTDKLVFRLWANSPRTARVGARIDVSGVSVGGRPVEYSLPESTMVVARPGRELAAGESVDITVPWRLTLPGTVSDRISRSGDAIRMGSFFPILAWEPGQGWAEQPPTSGFAESSTAIAADFTATITVPPGFDVMATGEDQGGGRWTASAVPDFALSVGHFTFARGTANAPQPVAVAVGVHAGIGESPQTYLAKIVRSLEDFGRRFGPYPYPTYTMAVTPVLGGGIEYPMHVLQGPGTIGRTTSHEVAHMWFYSLINNNQGRDPVLDEGLATWSEDRFEGTLGRTVNTAIPAGGKGRAGEPMTFWESRQSIYYRSVYVQGSQALAALGNPDLVDCALRIYVARNAYRVARPPDLIAAAAQVFPNAAAVLNTYGIR